jgi:hypothetical protein
MKREAATFVRASIQNSPKVYASAKVSRVARFRTALGNAGDVGTCRRPSNRSDVRSSMLRLLEQRRSSIIGTASLAKIQKVKRQPGSSRSLGALHSVRVSNSFHREPFRNIGRAGGNHPSMHVKRTARRQGGTDSPCSAERGPFRTHRMISNPLCLLSYKANQLLAPRRFAPTLPAREYVARPYRPSKSHHAVLWIVDAAIEA